MTSTLDDLVPLDAEAPAAPAAGSSRLRRVVAWLALLLVLAAALAIGAVLLFEQQYAGRILPGVRIGSVDVSGMTSGEASAALSARYAGLGSGTLVLDTPDQPTTITYADLGRRVDAEALVAEALAAGRSGAPLDRVSAELRQLINGTTIVPRVVYDAAALAARLSDIAAGFARTPVSAAVTKTSVAFVAVPASAGRSLDVAGATAAASAPLSALDAPAEIHIAVTVNPTDPPVTDAEASAAAAAADRMAMPVVLTLGKETWTINRSTVRSWIDFSTGTDGSLSPTLRHDRVTKAVNALSSKIARPARDATFLTGKGGSIVGVKASADGRALDVPGTVGAVEAAVLARSTGSSSKTPVTPVVSVVAPKLTTEAATKVAPTMQMISSWTTYYPIYVNNGFGANIEIPTRIIDGTVVPAGGTFDYWRTVGAVSTAGGYKQGGAIIDGHTEPQGALGGGMCSTSTTLFNAALRAGYLMGPRMNHFYYINRYPLGLDATVWITGGSVQSMSFTNDTSVPILIRGYIRHDGGRGYVTFELWTAPTGRTVSFTAPIVKNVLPATTKTEDSTTIPVGTRQQTEFPADGKDVWVTRTVRDRAGNVIRSETYYSHYARVDGVILVGVPKPAPTPSPTPSPTPVP